MKTAAAITAALVGSAAAFAPAQTGKSPTALKASIPEGYEDLVGIDVETGNKFVSLVPRVVRGGGGEHVAQGIRPTPPDAQKDHEPRGSAQRKRRIHVVVVISRSILSLLTQASCLLSSPQFDPWGLSQWMPAKWAREAELANARSAMLAVVGWGWPKNFGTFDSQDVTTTDAVDAIMQADPQWWAQFVIFCGTIEAFKYKAALDGKSYTGNGEPVIDWMNAYPKDEGRRREMELRELKNGRLAMIAIASFAANHFIPGSVPGLPADW